MYKDSPFPATNILIVKTSSLGDIIQTFDVLEELRSRFPEAAIDWVVEENLQSVAAAHPFIRRALPVAIQGLKKEWRQWDAWKRLFRSLAGLRQERYDLVFDLQANCKSGILTWLARGKTKVGFGIRSAREWPNVLATHVRFEVSKQMNIRLHYLQLIQKYFNGAAVLQNKGIRFKISSEEKQALASLLSKPQLQSKRKIMVCPGSKWANKQLPLETLIALLQKIGSKLEASFLLVWGSEAERQDCIALQTHFPKNSLIVDKLSLSAWQNLMAESDLVIAVDSSALHLCGTTPTPSFSLFGPTQSAIFKPPGNNHFAFQGSCPYKRTFEKTCPVLRTCPSGACIKQLNADALFEAFLSWWNHREKNSAVGEAPAAPFFTTESTETTEAGEAPAPPKK